MTYNNQIPQSTDSPSTSSSPIQVNFAQFAALFSSISAGVVYNHGAFNSNNQGKHAVVLMQNQTADPEVLQDQSTIYSINATSKAGTQPQLFARIPQFLPNEVPNTPMQLTYNTVNTTGPQYQSFLIGGYLFYFGVATFVSNTTITLSPSPTTILSAQAAPNTLISGRGATSTVSIINGATPQIMIISNDGGTNSFSWMAIAKA